MSKIKIFSGWSNPGGSTVAFINLTNLLNEKGHDCTFYGPHEWHLDQCKSGGPEDFEPEETDIVIIHFMSFEESAPFVAEKIILSCHETNLFPLKEMNLQGIDFVHFVSNSQKEWHDIDHPSVVIPNVLSKLSKRVFDAPRNAVGVIGSIDAHKRTDVAVRQALKQNPIGTKVRVFGTVTDQPYFNTVMQPLLDEHPCVEMMGHEDDKQKMYDKIDAVFHASKRETFNYIKAECSLIGIPYFGVTDANADVDYLTSESVYELWEEALEL